jgi:hypothetical protein
MYRIDDWRYSKDIPFPASNAAKSWCCNRSSLLYLFVSSIVFTITCVVLVDATALSLLVRVAVAIERRRGRRGPSILTKDHLSRHVGVCDISYTISKSTKDTHSITRTRGEQLQYPIQLHPLHPPHTLRQRGKEPFREVAHPACSDAQSIRGRHAE